MEKLRIRVKALSRWCYGGPKARLILKDYEEFTGCGSSIVNRISWDLLIDMFRR